MDRAESRNRTASSARGSMSQVELAEARDPHGRLQGDGHSGLGVKTDPFVDDFYRMGYTTEDARASGLAYEAFHQSEPDRWITAPPSLQHSYMDEDIPYGLVPPAALARRDRRGAKSRRVPDGARALTARAPPGIGAKRLDRVVHRPTSSWRYNDAPRRGSSTRRGNASTYGHRCDISAAPNDY